MERTDMVELGGLWWSKTKDGRAYLSGNLGATARIVILPNKAKVDGDRRPDFRVFIVPADRKDEKPKDQGATEQRGDGAGW
jgi:uncharacterized protein (DUF736 family)